MDTKQPYWQLAAIQVAGTGLTLTQVGRQLYLLHGLRTTIFSTLAGSLILWVIGLAAVAMTRGERIDAIENIRLYLGGPIARAIAVVTLLLFVFWQAVELESAALIVDLEIGPFFKNTLNLGYRSMIAAGIGVVFLAAWGIRLIKWWCSLALPFLFAFFAAAIAVNWSHPFANNLAGDAWRLSLSATMQVVSLTFAGMINLPTFFRHSRSMADSFLAIGLVSLGTPVWIIAGAWIPDLTVEAVGLSPFLVIPFVLLALACVNLVNIYFGAAGWDAFQLKSKPDQARAWSKERLIVVGLLGIGLFAILQIPKWAVTLQALLLGAIGCLAVTLLCSIVIELVVQHRPRRAGRIVTSVAWLLGCLGVVLVQFKVVPTDITSLGAGAMVTALAMLVILFIEETAWCAKKLFSKAAPS